MKKCLALVLLIVAMSSCNQAKHGQSMSDEDGTAVDSAAADCLTLKKYNQQTSLEDKAQWLRDYGKAVCEDTLHAAILKDHSVRASDVTFSTGVPFKIKWEDLDAFLDQNFYNAYVSFDIYKTNITGIKLIPTFTTSYPCYSVPFFKVIAAENKLKPTSEIEFKFGKIATNDRVIVIVNNDMGTAYYDYSNDPK
ncbi:hypothetical protein [Flavobacterium dankookense]|uniref:Lipoprotein n=1 Tax=Flavobacterium dankookense TaxID=706186 RepID=A0A4R6QFF2_9FLAO|nr:hypothetical protein [Flavobacterium dankookense]TDP61017.1 hypothetical protein BC748_0625 [Flavobacterium dankookense]